MIPTEVQAAGPEAVRRYKRCLKSGGSERLAEMLALRQAPRCKTDDTFLSGVGTLDQQVKNDIVRDDLVANAREYGYEPKPTDYYMGSMVPPGEKPGHPFAWFNHGAGRGELKKRARKLADLGYSSHGEYEVRGRDIEPTHVRLADDIVQQIYQERCQADPAVTLRDKREVCEQIVDEHGAPA